VTVNSYTKRSIERHPLVLVGEEFTGWKCKKHASN
jgi:hypothetical protein